MGILELIFDSFFLTRGYLPTELPYLGKSGEREISVKQLGLSRGVDHFFAKNGEFAVVKRGAPVRRRV